MKRLFVSAALLPLAYAVAAQAETKITTAVTTPVATATAANGQPDSLTIDASGSVKPAAAGAAVTLNSNHAVKNAGTIGFNNLNDSTGILVQGGRTASVLNSGTISLLEDYTPTDADKDGDLDGPFAQGANRFGVRVTGAGAFTGDIRNDGSIGVEGNASGGISVETQLAGSLVNAGAVQVVGDNSVGVAARSGVTGDVRILGAVSAQGAGATAVSLGDVGGVVQLQNTITATGFRYTDRLTEEAAGKLDADDLLQGGPAVLISGNVGKGVLLDRPPVDSSATDNDEDKDGITDSTESTASVLSYGSAPALQIGGAQATTIGAVGAGEEAYGLINRGQIGANAVNTNGSATALRIGGAGGGVTVAGGVRNDGTIKAQAYGIRGSVSQAATAVQILAGSSVPTLRNSGVIDATVTDGTIAAVAVSDVSGSLTLVENTGTIRAVSTPKAGYVPPSGSSAIGDNTAIALSLGANTTGVTVRQTKTAATSTPAIIGDVYLGSGADRLELLGGTLTGRMSFGRGADTLILDGAAVATGALADEDGQLAVDVRDGRLAVTNRDAVQISSLNLGAKGVLGVTVDPVNNQATRLNVSGAATLASGSQVQVSLASLQKGSASYELIRAGSLQGASGVTLSGAPYLYSGTLRSVAATNSLVLDLRPKTAAELGLNRSGAAAYDAVFAQMAASSALGSAALAQTTQAGFQSLYDQVLPDHSGGALMSAHAISGAISQAVGRPVSRQTDAATGVWAQEIMFHLDRERDAAQGFKSQGFGLAAGAEMLGDGSALGLSGSFVTADYKDQGAAAGERITMNFAEGGIYWRVALGGLEANARAGLGYVRFSSDRKISTAEISDATSAKWNGWLADLHAGASYEAGFGAFYVRPELSLDYLRLTEDSYQEAGSRSDIDLAVDERQGDLLTGEALVALGWRFGVDAPWGPELKLGWRAKLSGDPGSTTARFKGGSAFTLRPEELASGGAVARIGFSGVGGPVLYSVDAGGVFDDGYSEYDVRAVVRFLF